MFEATISGDCATSFASIAFRSLRFNQLDTLDQRVANGEPLDMLGMSDEQADQYLAWVGPHSALQVNDGDAQALADRCFIADMEAREQRWLDAAELAAAIERETDELNTLLIEAQPHLLALLSGETIDPALIPFWHSWLTPPAVRIGMTQATMLAGAITQILAPIHH